MTGQIPDWTNRVGPGWLPLLEQLHTDILTLEPDYVVAQLKLKFGSLRIYVDSPSMAVNSLIVEAERKAGTICEVCGEPGVVRDRPLSQWFSCRCDKHAA